MKRDIYSEITSKIIAQIEAGAGKWRMPWTGQKGGMPFNATTGARYRGVNVLNLWSTAGAAGYPTNAWASFKQWQARGAQVQVGQRGTLICYQGSTMVRDPGADADRAIRFLKYSHVFNAAQVDNWDMPEVERPNLATRIENAERFVANTGAAIRFDQGRAFYSPAHDFIGMPGWSDFIPTDGATATENAYGTLFHELTHWTGADKRCDRTFGKRFGDDAYAVEELVADLGSAFLCAHIGITAAPRPDHAQYLAHWLRVLKADARAIFTAAARASDAVEFLEGLQKAEAIAA